MQNTLNARIGRTQPSPKLIVIRHQAVTLESGSDADRPHRPKATYVGALLVAGILALLMLSNPRPAAGPIESASCPAESAR